MMTSDECQLPIETIEIKPTAWLNWCRLCGKEDRDEEQPLSHDNKMPDQMLINNLRNLTSNTVLTGALDKHFDIKLSRDDLMPNSLCSDCLCIVSNTLAFSDHAVKVQEMYSNIIHDPQTGGLEELRFKYLELNSKRKYIFCNYRKGIIALEYLNAKLLKEDQTPNKPYSFPELQKIDSEELKDDLKIDPFETNTSSGNESKCESEKECSDDSKDLASPSDEEKEKMQNMKKKKLKSNKKAKKCILRKKSKLKIDENISNFTVEMTCKKCNYDITSYENYKEHLRLKHNQSLDGNPHKCLECRNKYKTASGFEKHLRVGHQSKELRYSHKCEQCKERFETENRLERHRKYKHEDDRPYICEECGKRYRTETTLKDHMLCHTDEMAFECKECNIKYKRESKLKDHIFDKHSGIEHKCHICGMILNSRQTLRVHFLVHSDEARHKCDQCGRGFKRVKNLREHLIIHSGLKPYTCEFCDCSFANGSTRRAHMKRIHPKEVEACDAAGIKPQVKIPSLKHLKEASKHVNLMPKHSPQFKKNPIIVPDELLFNK